MRVWDRTQHGQVESFFVPEIIVNRCDIRSGLFADLAYGRGAKAELGKHLAGGI